MKRLLEMGQDVFAIDDDGHSVLFVAVQEGYMPCVELVLDAAKGAAWSSSLLQRILYISELDWSSRSHLFQQIKFSTHLNLPLKYGVAKLAEILLQLFVYCISSTACE